MSLHDALLKAGLVRPLDHALARSLQRLRGDTPDSVLAAAALASLAVAQGHAGFDPGAAQLLFSARGEVEPPPLPAPAAWRADLLASPWVAVPDSGEQEADPSAPLVLEGGLLYLRRYREYERSLALGLRRIAAASLPAFDAAALAGTFAALFPAARDGDRQARAAALALRRALLLVTGGPGTGKTTTIAKLLVLRLAQATAAGQPAPRIALAAPTGRAAERMAESLRRAGAALAAAGIAGDGLAALPTTASTLHRLLGSIPDTPRFRHHADNPLPQDIVVVDEASMVDLPLMAKLVDAVADGTQLILLGDADQLPSVEAGDVLAAILAAAGPGDALATDDAAALAPLGIAAAVVPGLPEVFPAAGRPATPGVSGTAHAEAGQADTAITGRSAVAQVLATASLPGPPRAGNEQSGEANAVLPGPGFPVASSPPDKARADAEQSSEALAASPAAGLPATPGLCGPTRPDVEQTGTAIPAPPMRASIVGCRVNLLRAYRQVEGFDLAPLAEAVRAGDADTALALLRGGSLAGVHFHEDVADPFARRREALLAHWRALAEVGDPAEALRRAGTLRLLTAVREGPQGARGLNARIEALLADTAHGRRGATPYFPGRLLLVTENSYRHGLFNGDVGLCLPDADGTPVAWFPGGQGEAGESPASAVRGFHPGTLPAHESAFAMTVHKAQGSEFDTVWLQLPARDARVLSRELLYTGLTRAKAQVHLAASETVLRAALARHAARVSGLGWRLGGDEGGQSADVPEVSRPPVADEPGEQTQGRLF